MSIVDEQGNHDLTGLETSVSNVFVRANIALSVFFNAFLRCASIFGDVTNSSIFFGHHQLASQRLPILLRVSGWALTRFSSKPKYIHQEV
jgi:hypothetical protein